MQSAAAPNTPFISVKNLSVEFQTEHGTAEAVRDLSFQLNKGDCLGLVGESGSGKSVTCLAILGLLPETARVTHGSILFDGKDLLQMSPEDRRELRAARMSMVFQEPMTSLNPVFRIGQQISEAIRVSDPVSKAEATKRAEELLDRVQIPEAKKRLRSYPHEMSGGMRQRVMIAMALSSNPELLIADEPTTALDVTIQAQILELLADLQKDEEMTMIFVTHDLGVVAQVADRVNVMYAGQLVESCATDPLFRDPLMPYTKGLLKSIPALTAELGSSRLATIPGSGPDARYRATGCAFAPRCAEMIDECSKAEIPLRTFDNRSVRCIRADLEAFHGE